MKKRAAFVGAGAIVLVVVVVLVAIGATGLGPMRPLFRHPISPAAHGGIVRIQLAPIPEGPAGPTFERNGGLPCSRPVCPKPLALIRRFIPNPLPAPLNQLGWNMGGDLVVRFADGQQVTCGPCHRPASINHLWAEMIYVMENGRCAPYCGAGGAPGP